MVISWDYYQRALMEGRPVLFSAASLMGHLPHCSGKGFGKNRADAMQISNCTERASNGVAQIIHAC